MAGNTVALFLYVLQEPNAESEYVYLIVEMKGLPSKTIVIYDKR